MRIYIEDKYDSFYFIGIGGVSMSGLAKYFLSEGKKVGGYDAAENQYTEELKSMGAQISIGEEQDSVKDYSLIVYTDAIKENDYHLCEAKKLSKNIISRGQLLYEVSRSFKKVIAVSGCHGKTTCCSMLAHIFAAAGKKFTAHIGGSDSEFTNFYSGGKDFFITEACEYKKNFLLLKPDIAVILNSGADHLECYGSEQALTEAYLRFANSAVVAVSLYRDLPINFGYSFGYDKCADYFAKKIQSTGGAYSFTAYEGAEELGEISLNVYGKHNVLNAVAAIAAARSAGIQFEFIKDGLNSFTGVERRFENIGSINGAVCIADYAHHPEELRAVIRTAKKICLGKLYVIFQPHTYSRTKNLFSQFVKVLAPLNNLLIFKTFAAREYFDDSGSALTLSQSVKKSHYGDDMRDISEFISKAGEGDMVLFLGAGDIYFIAKNLIKNLPARP
ncbi:MAG: UDP-N-acetylmuramate--L-alanine ligase [Clostridia bacterium]|nr:UDP-N-acetylmuramate--L-alanine ligase [Clostridia bacterium]